MFMSHPNTRGHRWLLHFYHDNVVDIKIAIGTLSKFCTQGGLRKRKRRPEKFHEFQGGRRKKRKFNIDDSKLFVNRLQNPTKNSIHDPGSPSESSKVRMTFAIYDATLQQQSSRTFLFTYCLYKPRYGQRQLILQGNLIRISILESRQINVNQTQLNDSMVKCGKSNLTANVLGKNCL